MRKTLIVGAGGIGSFLVMFLKYYKDRDQLNDMDLTILDPDKVESKNLKYSNFLQEDIGKHKAEVLGNRYGFEYTKAKLISPAQLKDYDLVILAVDNSEARNIVYKSDIFWIDCRSKGMEYSVFFKSKDTKNNTLNLKRAPESCQYDQRLKEGIVDCGNVISAAIGVAQILNYFRGTLSVSEIVGII